MRPVHPIARQEPLHVLRRGPRDGYIVNYGLPRKFEALAVFKRCVVDMAHNAGTAVKCVRGDLDALWTSRGFVEFCDSMGIARGHSLPGAQQYNGVAESAS